MGLDGSIDRSTDWALMRGLGRFDEWSSGAVQSVARHIHPLMSHLSTQLKSTLHKGPRGGHGQGPFTQIKLHTRHRAPHRLPRPAPADQGGGARRVRGQRCVHRVVIFKPLVWSEKEGTTLEITTQSSHTLVCTHTGHVSPAYRDSHLKPLVDLFCLSEACLVAGTTMFVHASILKKPYNL